MRTNYRAEILRGKKTKPCPGPRHRGKELPLDQFHRRVKNDPTRLRSWCKECELVRLTKRGDSVSHGLIPVARVKFIFIELVERLGFNEARRRVGISHTTLNTILKSKRQFTQKRIVEAGVLALRECRAKHEVRDRRSISHGAEMRGKSDRLIVNSRNQLGQKGMKLTKADKELDKFLRSRLE